MSNLASSLQRFNSALNKILSQNISLTPDDSSITDFKEKKQAYLLSSYKSSLKDLLSFPEKNILEKNPKNQEAIEKITSLLKELKQENNLEKTKELTEKLTEIEKTLIYPKQETLTFNIKNLPQEIKEDMKADLVELEKCFKSQAYRASVILCGRLLETALHRVYYQLTNNDLLEKSPGIGLGNLIARMKEKNLKLDPAVSQQIHLINQVRIYSVHRKKQAFYPTKEQTHAIILYTIDIIKKLFS